MVSSIAALLSLVFFVLGLLFLPVKLLRKDIENSTYRILYKLHLHAPKLATILALLHGFTVSPVVSAYLLSGWILGISLILMLAIGAFLTIKTGSEPLDDQGDVTWKNVRIFKYLLTIVAIISLVLHYIPI
jgi:hypothetical protein